MATIQLISEQFLAELSLGKLQRNTDKFFDTDREGRSHDASIDNIAYTPSVDNGSLLCNSVASTVDGTYKVVVELQGVNISTQPSDGMVEFQATNGNKYFLMPASYNLNNVKVSCQCLDFYMRFAFYDYNADALHGRKPKPYVKRPGSNRGPANPARVPGMCKHIRALAYKMMDDGLIK